MKQVLAFIAAAALLLSPALAAAEPLPADSADWSAWEEKFPADRTPPGFIDIEPGAWYEEAAKICAACGLMQGTSHAFDPNGTLTVGETAAIAARLNERLTGQEILLGTPEPGVSVPWYDWYVQYLERLGIEIPNPEEAASRETFVTLLAAVVPEEGLAPRNAIETLPDTADGAVLSFYNAGILTGVDKYGTFAPDKTLTRAECAAMLARIVRPGLRLGFVPNDYRPLIAAGLKPDSILFQTESRTVTAGEFLPAVTAAIDELEAACAAESLEFNWFHTYGDQTFLDYVRETAMGTFGVTRQDGTGLYKNFDVQVFYSRLLDLKQ